MKPTIGNTVDTGKPLAIDIDKLLLTRMLLQADSSGGTSELLGVNGGWNGSRR